VRSSLDFVRVLDYTNDRNFEGVIDKARSSCFNRGHRVENHFVDTNQMVEIGARLEARIQQFDALMAESHPAIDLLQERRIAIISAAATGQIDVRQLILEGFAA
jgi:hypothetical protein